ncbi:hypothetical protein MC885_006512 [Smutsia gigantea]|nr:hypothetical protein MC885_006512 [Smutsia gigantea]
MGWGSWEERVRALAGRAPPLPDSAPAVRAPRAGRRRTDAPRNRGLAGAFPEGPVTRQEAQCGWRSAAPDALEWPAWLEVFSSLGKLEVEESFLASGSFRDSLLPNQRSGYQLLGFCVKQQNPVTQPLLNAGHWDEHGTLLATLRSPRFGVKIQPYRRFRDRQERSPHLPEGPLSLGAGDAIGRLEAGGPEPDTVPCECRQVLSPSLAIGVGVGMLEVHGQGRAGLRGSSVLVPVAWSAAVEVGAHPAALSRHCENLDSVCSHTVTWAR